MKYIGEHLLPGQIGHLLTLLSLVASLMATIAYFMANRLGDSTEKTSWIKMARGAFFVETVSVFQHFWIDCLYYI